MTFSKTQLKKLKSTIAGATASVFAFTTVSVPVVEANFWQDRQKAARTVAVPSSADAGTAESRSLYAGMFKGANPMLLDEKAVDGVAAGARDLVTKGLADLVTPRTTDQKPLPAWMRTLVTPFGEIDDFHVTGSLRNAADWSFDKSADPVIVLIQDVHNVPEAQLNISKIMESYQTRAGLSVVGLEGATGGLLTDKFRAMNAPEALRWASDFLINERVLSGAEYFGLNAPRSATLWGIEDEAAYLANVEAYKQTVALRPDVAAFEASANGALAALQEKVYSADLKTFERQRSLYADEKISLSDYVESIAAGPALRAGVNPNAYPNIALFRKAILLEKTIDFKKVEAERTEFLQALTARLSKDDLTRLVALSMEFRLHHVGFGDYYKALSAAAARVKVDLSN
ncbi:MAG TPA: hypothetical protein PKD69_06280, partial [Elusimicrobiota bacterium]|nr:hypothetical protein [Elusimicrobiota bacterium]